MTVLLVLAGLFLGVQAAVLLINVATFPVMVARDGEADVGGRVSLLVPARDEAENLLRTLPLLLAQPADEILVLDDASTDRTRDLVQTFAASDARLEVLSGRPLPSGWNGKNWACHQLAEAASGDLLVFTDADVLWQPGALAGLLSSMRSQGAGLLSVWPRQRTVTWWERLVVPLVDMVLLGGLPYPAVKGLPFSSLAAGNGQCMLWTRSAYRLAGGHQAVRGEVLEDVRLAQKAKAAGVVLALGLGGRALEVRMYRSWRELVAGFSKNILKGSGSVPALIALVTLNTLAYLASWPLAVVDRRWLLVAVGGLALRAITNLKVGRPAWELVLQPLAPVPLWIIALRALRNRGGYEWKGRKYP